MGNVNINWKNFQWLCIINSLASTYILFNIVSSHLLFTRDSKNWKRKVSLYMWTRSKWRKINLLMVSGNLFLLPPCFIIPLIKFWVFRLSQKLFCFQALRNNCLKNFTLYSRVIFSNVTEESVLCHPFSAILIKSYKNHLFCFNSKVN